MILGRVGAAALVGLIYARLKSGRSFGGMGKWLGEKILGDIDERAIARSMASEHIAQQPELMLEVLRHGRATPFIEGLHKSLAEDVYYPQVRGGALFGLDERFDVNSLLDIVILRLRDLVQLVTR